MKLLMFDVDGTLVNSMGLDGNLFVKAIKETFKSIDDVDTDWDSYTHATDSCILDEISKKHNVSYDAEKFESIFLSFINESANDNKKCINEIKGASNFFEYVKNNKKYAVSIATGGYEKPALLKMKHAGFNYNNIPISSSADGYSREDIMFSALDKAKKNYGVEEFDDIIYLGDGLWDYRACKNTGFKFIAIDSGKKFTNHQDIHKFKDFECKDEILKVIEKI